MDKIEFYAECDRLLGQAHAPPKVHKYRGRWGPREPGSGRYEGYGLIRWFSTDIVHVAINYPSRISTTCTSQCALDMIETMLDQRGCMSDDSS